MKLGDKATYFPEGSDPLAAIDTNGLLALCVYVHLSGLVNLCVFSPHGRAEGRTNVPVVNGADVAITPGSCKLMQDVVAPPASLPAADTITLDAGPSSEGSTFTLTLPDTTEMLAQAPSTSGIPDPNTLVETKVYTDGTSATGTPPLPDMSPAQQDAADAAAADFQKAQEPPVLSDVVQTSDQYIAMTQSPGIPQVQDTPVNVDGVDTSSNPIQ